MWSDDGDCTRIASPLFTSGGEVQRNTAAAIGFTNTHASHVRSDGQLLCGSPCLKVENVPSFVAQSEMSEQSGAVARAPRGDDGRNGRRSVPLPPESSARPNPAGHARSASNAARPRARAPPARKTRELSCRALRVVCAARPWPSGPVRRAG